MYSDEFIGHLDLFLKMGIQDLDEKAGSWDHYKPEKTWHVEPDGVSFLKHLRLS